MKHHPNGSFKIVMVYSALVYLSAGARYTSFPGFSPLHFADTTFSGVVDIFKSPLHLLIINKVANSCHGP